MSNLGGLEGALLLSNQISTNRLMDTYRRAREANSLALNDAAWRNQYNHLVDSYNRLVDDTNRLADAQDRSIEAQAGHIADLRATNDMLWSEIDRLRFKVVDLASQVDFLRAMDKALHPEAYQSVYSQT